MWFMTEERELMRNVAREFVEKEVLPVSLEMDMKEEYPLHLFRRAGELGLIGVVYPEEFGGLGGDWVTKLLITEELSKGSPTLNIAIGAIVPWLAGPNLLALLSRTQISYSGR